MPHHEFLLTGASGFLGAHLAAELLKEPNTHAHLLVNAENAVAAEEKLQSTARGYGLPPLPAGQYTLLTADLAAPDLITAYPNVPTTLQRVSTVIHAAAKVHLGMSYDSLKPVNVNSTRQLLRIALQHPTMHFHHISTLSVFNSPDTAVEVLESPQQPGLTGGYEQSKWVAEQIVAMAGNKGLPVAIHRTGRLFSNSRTGGFNPNDLLIQLLKACFTLGVAPDLHGAIEFEPVDLVAAQIVRIARLSNEYGRAYHHHGRILIAWDLVLRTVDSDDTLVIVPYLQWLAHLRSAQASTHPSILRLATILDEREPFAGRQAPESGSDFTDPELKPYLAALNATAPFLRP